MPIFIIDKLKPKNDGVFKLMDTLNIDHKGYGLDVYLDSIDRTLDDILHNAAGQKLLEMKVVGYWLSWRYVGDEEWNRVLDISKLGGGSGGSTTSGGELYVGADEPEDMNVKLWIDTSEESEETDDEFIQIPTKLSELENNMNFISVNDLKDKLKITKSGSSIILSYDGSEISKINI